MVTIYERATDLLVTANPAELDELVNQFRFRPNGYHFALSFQRFRVSRGEEGWDGYIRPLQKISPNSAKILRGRKEELIKHAELLGYELDLSHLLPTPFANLEIDDIPANAIAGEFELDMNQRMCICDWLRAGVGCNKITIGGGKCLAKGTKVMLFNGRSVAVETLKVGDLLMGPDSKPRRVVELGHGYGELYTVSQANGVDYTCNDEHILALQEYKRTGSFYGKNCHNFIDRTFVKVSDFAKFPKWKRLTFRGYKTGISFRKKRVELDPYFLGLWLGDGSSDSAAITSGDVEVIDYLRSFASTNALGFREEPGSGCSTWHLTRTCGAHLKGSKNPIVGALKRLDLFNKKENGIPDRYLFNSREIRLQLMAGLIDSDGHLKAGRAGQVELTSIYQKLADDIVKLARSLGYSASVKPKHTSCQTGAVGKAYRVRITGTLAEIPTLIARKKLKDGVKNLRTQIKVLPAGTGEWFGFVLDGDHLFLLEDFTVSHNTATFAGAASVIKQHYPDARFLYITPSERLVRQATKDLKGFLPKFDIGQCGGGHHDFDARDMVVCTVSMLSKHFTDLKATGWFDTFLGILYDECITGDSLVAKSDGTFECIQAIVDSGQPVDVKTYNEVTGDVEVKRAFGIRKGIREIVVVSLHNGAKIRCTPEHLVFTMRGWICAGNLTPDDYILYADERPRTADLRKLAGRCLDGYWRALPVPEVSSKPQFEASSLGYVEVSGYTELNRNSSEDCRKQGVGRRSVSFYNTEQPRLRRNLQNSLSKQAQDDNEAVVGQGGRTRSSVVVYGRWSAREGRSSAIYRRLFKEGESCSGVLAAGAVACKTGSDSLEKESLVSPVPQEGRRRVLQADRPVCYTGNEVQAIPRNLGILPELSSTILTEHLESSLLQEFRVPPSGQAEQQEKGTSAHAGKLPEKSFEDSSSSAPETYRRYENENMPSLRTPVSNSLFASAALLKIRVREDNAPVEQFVRVSAVSAAGREQVFDLTVVDNHNYFANGFLVHNCHHSGAKSSIKILEAIPAYFRLGASDTSKEKDPTRFNNIRGLFGPMLNDIKSAPLIEIGRLAKPHIYIVDIPAWQSRFSSLPHRPAYGSPAYTLIESEWVPATYAGPVYELDAKGKVKTKRVKLAEKDANDEWLYSDEPVTVPGLHKLMIDGVEHEIESSWCLLKRMYDRAIITFKSRNAMIVEWAKYFNRKGWPTVVVATRTTHVYILEALLTEALPKGAVRIMTGEASPKERDATFEWLKSTPGACLITPLLKEGVSINQIRAMIVADSVADIEVARQIIGRAMRPKKEGDNRAHVIWFWDRQHPVLSRTCRVLFTQLEKQDGFSYYHPCAGPETVFPDDFKK